MQVDGSAANSLPTNAAASRRSVIAQRIAIGFVGVVALATVVMLDVVVARFADEAPVIPQKIADLLRRGSAIPLVFVTLSVLGAVEFDRLLRRKGIQPFSRFGLIVITMLMLLPWLSAAGWLGDGAHDVEGLYWQLAVLALAPIGAFMLVVGRGRTDGSIVDAAATLLMIVYLGFLPSFAIQIRSGRTLAEQDGAWLVLMVLLIAKSSDIGGYLVGTAIGRRKLIPGISAGKSVEGAIGGLLLSMTVAVGLAYLGRELPNVEPPAASSITSRALDLVAAMTRPLGRWNGSFLGHMAAAAFLGASLGVVSQFGDLIESCFKRDAGAKDSSSLIGHAGGILDLIDSAVFAVPVAWILLTTMWNR